MSDLDKILRGSSIYINPSSLYFETEEGILRKKMAELEGKQVELPKRYIINNSACILFWKNGEKTVVKRCADDEFNPRLAFLTAFFQHYCGKRVQ